MYFLPKSTPCQAANPCMKHEMCNDIKVTVEIVNDITLHTISESSLEALLYFLVNRNI